MPVIVSAVWFFILSAALTKKADKRTDKNVRVATNGSEYGCGDTNGSENSCGEADGGEV